MSKSVEESSALRISEVFGDDNGDGAWVSSLLSWLESSAKWKTIAAALIVSDRFDAAAMAGM